MFRSLSLILGLSISLPATGQEINVDSLWGIWNDKSESDTDRVDALLDVIKAECFSAEFDSANAHAQLLYGFSESIGLQGGMARALYWQGRTVERTGDLRSALDLYGQSMAIHQEYQDTMGISQCLNTIGIVYGRQGDYEKALEYFLKDLDLMENLDVKINIASTLNNVGIVYRKWGLHDKAMECYMRTLRIWEELGRESGISHACTNIGKVHREQGDLEKALEYYQRGLEIDRRLGDKMDEAICLTNIGNIYWEQRKFDEARRNFEESYALWVEMESAPDMVRSIHNIGKVLFEEGKHREAMVNYQKALVTFRELGLKTDIVGSLIAIGRYYYDAGDHPNALKNANEAYVLAQELGSVEDIQNSAGLLYEVYKATGDKGKALEMHEKYIVMRDSIMSEKNQREVFRQEYKYTYEKEALADSLEFAKTEAVLKEKNEKQQVGLAAVGGGLLLVIALAFSIYRGKKKSDELLLNILPYETAQELKRKGHADARQFDQVTVLFTDFKGFTQMAEKLTAKELVAEIDECFKAFDEIMEKYNIEKIKTIGDAYMAAGGLPVQNSASPENVVRAALEIRDYMEAHQIVKGENAFEIRIGIHTGPVVAGIVGIKKFAYDIWGDTVNTAARMESSGEVGKVNISETTYQLVQDHFSCEYRGEIEAKGKGKVKMYFVEQA